MQLFNKQHFYMALFAVLPCIAQSQVSTYVFQHASGTYTPITGGSVVGTTTSDDQVFVDPAVPAGTGAGATGVGFPIGFTFVFDGISYDRFGINNNGWICLGQSALGATAVNTNSASGYTPISSTSTASAALQHHIAGYGRDLQGQTGSELRLQTIGTAPNRVCVIQWTNYRRFAATGDVMNFQIRLNETTNVVEVVYGAWSATVTTSNTAQVGLRGGANTDFNNRSVISGTNTWNNSFTGGVNSATVAFLNTLLPVNGQIYRWTPSPSNCANSLGLAASGITSTNANFNWSTSLASGQIVVVPAGNNVTSGTPIAVSGTTSTIGSLLPGSSYRVYLRRICGAGDTSNWSAPVLFTTLCTGFTVPWSDGFETMPAVGTGIVPNCWAKTGDFSTQTGTQTQNRFPRTGTKYAYTQWSTIAGGDHLFTPGFNLTAGVSYDFSYYYVTDGFTNWDSIRVGVGTSQTAAAMTYIGPRVINPSNMAYQQHVVSFTPATSGTYYFGVDVFCASSTPWYITFDDFRLDLTPTCPQPNTLAASNITATSVDFGWNSIAPGSSWYVSTVTQGSPVSPSTAVLTTSNPYSITGLAPNTPYSMYVREYCSAGDTSFWSGPVNFRTLCDPAGAQGDSMQTAYNVTSTTYSTTNSTAFCYTNTIGNASPDVWYRVILDPCATTISANLCTGSTFDTYIRLYAADGTTLLASNDNGCGLQSTFSGIDVTNRDTVYVVVEGFSTNTGTYGLNITQATFIPTANISYAQASYCQNATSNPLPINAGTTGGFFSELTNSLTMDNISGELYLSTAAPATYSIVYTVGQVGCQFSDTAIVTTTAPDNASFSYAGSTNGQAAICTNAGVVSPTITGLAGGTFSGDSTSISLNTTSGDVDASASQFGTHTIQYLTNGACPNTATFNISIDTVQDASFNYTQAAVCANNTNVMPNITGLMGGTFASATGLVLNPTTGEIDVTNSAPATYTVTYTMPNACASQGTATFTIDPLIDASFSYSQTSYCKNAANPAPIITGTPGGVFSSGTGLTVDLGTGVIDLAAATVGTTHTVIYAVNGTCANFEVVTVTILDADDASFHYDSTTYCQGTTIPAATVTGDAGGAFSTSGGLTLNASTGAILNLNTVAAGTYTVQYVTNGPTTCRDTATATVNVVNCVVTNVNNLSTTNEYRLFPNPNNGNFFVMNDGAAQQVTIQVMDVLGQTIYRQENVNLDTKGTFNIQLDEMAPGAYFVQVSNGKQTQTFKVTVITR